MNNELNNNNNDEKDKLDDLISKAEPRIEKYSGNKNQDKENRNK